MKLPPVKIRAILAQQEGKIKGWKLAILFSVKIWANIEEDAGNIQIQAIKVHLIWKQYSVYYPLLQDVIKNVSTHISKFLSTINSHVRKVLVHGEKTKMFHRFKCI